ncbi:MAG TPA: IspD/TarI family cytidylyltransferase, partial [Solirubrobacterales bacterium]|nr:IspD/TarI family cytidylyltransferase [Solirubrobacterales bacterium]
MAAAGSGERLGCEGPKALVELAGRPMIAWSLQAFAAAAEVSAAVVAAPPGGEDELRDAVAAPDGLELRVVAGGPTRSESVAAALAALDEPTDLVAVHDAARPLVTPELVDGVIETLLTKPEAAGAIAAGAVTDTIKRSPEPRGTGGGSPAVAATESREHLWAAQTPQVFRTPALRDALAADPRRVAQATDDAWLVEQAGGTVLIHPSPPENIKVTTP